MLGYGHDESVPYAWRNVRNQFRGCSQRYRKPLAAKWQTVSSRRGPIYRARIYVYTHEMADGNVRAVMWIHVFNNVEMRIWLWKYAFWVMSGYGHDKSVPYA